jgi:S1-C subfamily serine protease
MKKSINLGAIAIVGILVFLAIAIQWSIIWKDKNAIVAQESARKTFVVDVVRRVSPAVVNISTEQVVVRGGQTISPYGTDPSLDEFYRDFFEPDLRASK